MTRFWMLHFLVAVIAAAFDTRIVWYPVTWGRSGMPPNRGRLTWSRWQPPDQPFGRWGHAFDWRGRFLAFGRRRKSASCG